MRRPAPGTGFAHQNGEQRVCGEPSANRAGAAAGKKGKFRLRVCASKRRIKGLRGAERKPRRRCSGKKGKSRLRVCASKRRIKGLRGTERKPRRRCSEGKEKFRHRVCASKRRTKGLRGAERKPRRQEKSRRLSLVSGGSGDGIYATFNFGCSGKLWPGRMFFLWSIKR